MALGRREASEIELLIPDGAKDDALIVEEHLVQQRDAWQQQEREDPDHLPLQLLV